MCIVLTAKRYKTKGKQAIKDGLDKVQKSVVEEEMEKVYEIDKMIGLKKRDMKQILKAGAKASFVAR